MKGMILAAGLGTRLKPFTEKHPKALALVNGKSLLAHNIHYLKQYGVKEVIVNVHHFADQIVEEITKNNAWGIDVSISDERDQVLETGGGLLKAEWFFKDSESPFVLMNVDILMDLDINKLIEQHNKNKALATLAVSDRLSSRYFLFDSNKNLVGWENTKTETIIFSKQTSDYHRQAFSGLHLISPQIFNLIKQKGKFSMVDVYVDLASSQTIQSYNQGNCRFIDVGTPERLLQAEELFKNTVF